MDKTILPRPLGGTIQAIASKSHAHRLLICAALADTPTLLRCTHRSADLDATVRCLRALGARICLDEAGYHVTPVQAPPREACLDCGESGASLRFLLPVAAALGVRAAFALRGRLAQRPLDALTHALSAHGCTIRRPDEHSLLCSGQLCPGSYELPGNVSSQYISGLLLALPLLPGASELRVSTPCESAQYIKLTLSVQRTFGVCVDAAENGWRVRPARYRGAGSVCVEGDWSNAAFWLCAGAISRPVTVTGLSLRSEQGDRQIVPLLARFGAAVECRENALSVCPAPLRAAQVDLRGIPDLAPPLAVLAACAQGQTLLTGAARLRFKESDRLQSIAAALNALGGRAQALPDALRIDGCAPLRGGTVCSHNDHRIAMLAAIAASVCTAPVTVTGAQATEKSDPAFWRSYAALQGRDDQEETP